MRSFYIALPEDAADRLRELAWRERRSPRQQAAVLVLAALDPEAPQSDPRPVSMRQPARPGRRTRRPDVSEPRA